MRICIEARVLSNKGGGIKTYTEELIKNLLMQKKESDEIAVIYDKQELVGSFSEAKEVAVRRYGEVGLAAWLNWQIPRAVKSLRPDVVHYTKADVPKKKAGRTVVTIYDVIPLLFPESQKITRRMYWPYALKRAAACSDQIITISETSKRDIVKLLEVGEDKVTAIPLAVDAKRFDGVTESRDTPYILYVGTIELRKNVTALIKAYAKIAHEVPHDLVIAGRGYKGMESVDEAIEMSGVSARIKKLGFVSDKKLPALYGGADLFVWPSIYEGWGLPPQEAMASGVPVIVSDGGSLPEVVGEAGEIVRYKEEIIENRLTDKDFEEDLAIAMKETINDEEKKMRMRNNGQKRVAEWTWENVAKQTYEVYEK